MCVGNVAQVAIKAAKRRQCLWTPALWLASYICRRLTGSLLPEEFAVKSNSSGELLLLLSIGFLSVLEE